MTKLFFTKIMQNLPHLFLTGQSFRSQNRSVLVPDTLLYYLALHLKFASSSSATQLVELFAYENPSSIVSYQFHNLFSQERLFVFVVSSKNTPALRSIGELFFSSTWLEREVGEMHGVCFEGKKDLRNLLLQYGDASSPLQKSYPSIGTKEVFYDSVTDALSQVPVSTQI